MKHLLITSLIILLVFGCKTKEENKEFDSPIITEETIPYEPVPQSLDVGCYTYDANGNKMSPPRFSLGADRCNTLTPPAISWRHPPRERCPAVC